MLKNFLTVALRNYYRRKVYSIVNLTGLTLALTIAILAILFIRHEMSYDAWMPNQKNIYKVYRQWGNSGGTSYTPIPLAETLVNEFPEVQHATRIVEGENVLLTYDDKAFYAQKTVFTDSSLLKVLPLKLKYGNEKWALDLAHAVILSEQAAEKFFGDENPVGKSIRINSEIDLMISGVLAPPAGNTHLDVDIYFTAPEFFASTSWTGNNPATYVSLNPESDTELLETKMTDRLNQYIQKEITDLGISYEKFPNWKLQPMADIHLNQADVSGPLQGKGNISSMYVIALVALVILILASINYMNLATAQASQRAKEVGVRKVTGASSHSLVWQFLLEAMLQTLLTLPLAILLADLLLPSFEFIIGRELSFSLDILTDLIPYLLLTVLFLGLISGSYPAFFLSAYKPAEVLKGKVLRKNKGKMLQNALVITQFSGAMVAAILMFIIYQQVEHMQNKELGFQQDQVVVVPINTADGGKRIAALKHQLLQNSKIESISTSTALPGTAISDYGFDISGISDSKSVDILFTDTDLAQTLGLEMTEGRFFSKEFSADTVDAYVVNEAFLKEFDIKDPIGHQIKFSGDYNRPYGTIIGVVKDFHYQSLKHSISPLAFRATYRYTGQPYYASIKVSADDIGSTISVIEGFWKNIEPEHPFRYSFLDEDFSELYLEQQRLGKTLLYASLVAILVATLGLFGLASFLAEQRTKEIGIRKVLGARVSQIVYLLGKDFLIMICIAGVVATPIAFWLAQQWLSSFAYQTPLSLLPALIVIVSALMVTLLTVCSRGIYAAKVNPVNSLRNE
ncbi:ABC transporter permease [Catalinimonas sp. 4WD22]|uniref:ABC transporter permease n=1 Tax=Catalinimonas locisalis TaxID=3133978 RepID=UPI0031017C55